MAMPISVDVMLLETGPCIVQGLLVELDHVSRTICAGVIRFEHQLAISDDQKAMDVLVRLATYLMCNLDNRFWINPLRFKC